MNANHFEELDEGNQLSLEERYAEAAQSYSKVATKLILEGQNNELAELARELAVNAYRIALGRRISNRITRPVKDDLKQQYFVLLRYFEDHQDETDEQLVQRMITEEISLNEGEKQFFFNIFSQQIVVIPEDVISTSSKQIGPYHLSVISAQGPREEMEDEHHASEFEIKGGSTVQLFAVLDGHGGEFCAKYVKSQLRRQIVKHLDTSSDLAMYNALKNVCIQLDKKWKQYSGSTFFPGTTATIALIIGKTLWVANVGDSRVVVGNGGKAVQLSEDAKPYIPKFQEEIIRRGGYVNWDRTDGSLDMARSIGDISHPSVSARPTIRKFDLKNLDHKKQNILLIACDGLWDVVGSQKAIDHCQKFQTVKEMVVSLKTLAYQSGSTDNVTILAIDLNTE